MSPKLLILADDLTGANDTGVQFAQRGLTTLVSLWPEQDITALAQACQVLVVNTESRHCHPDEAFQRVFRAAQRGVELGFQKFYKKTDSTLRGNVGSELAAMLAATSATELFFAPAYPKLKRTTQHGRQFVNGLALGQSAFAHDPHEPRDEASIAVLLARQTSLAVQPFTAWPEQTDAQTIYIVDAINDEELRRAAQQLSSKPLLAGSAGWAEFLAAQWSATTTPVPCPALHTPMLIVNGSLHETSLQQVTQQVTHAAEAGCPVITLSTATAAQVCEQLAQQQRAILTTNATVREAQAVNRLAAITSAVMEQVTLKTLVVFGGDTLAAIAAKQGWTAFRPQAERLPGVPVVTVAEQQGLQLLTKAGGFGATNLLSEIFEQPEG